MRINHNKRLPRVRSENPRISFVSYFMGLAYKTLRLEVFSRPFPNDVFNSGNSVPPKCHVVFRDFSNSSTSIGAYDPMDFCHAHCRPPSFDTKFDVDTPLRSSVWYRKTRTTRVDNKRPDRTTNGVCVAGFKTRRINISDDNIYSYARFVCF